MSARAGRRAQLLSKFETSTRTEVESKSSDINGNVSTIVHTEKKIITHSMNGKPPSKTSSYRESKTIEKNDKDLKKATDGLKVKGRPQSLEARMLERKREREREQKKKTMEQQRNRNVFKQQLEVNSPKPDPNQCALKRADSNIDRLLRWVQKRVNKYQGVQVTDFSSSWADGMAFCALMHVLVPDKITMDGIHPADRRKNFETAFRVASAEGVAELLDVEDMVRVSAPDHRSIVTYVHMIYKVMVIDKQKENDDKKQ